METLLRQVAASTSLLSALQGRPGHAKASQSERLRLQGLLAQTRGLRSSQLGPTAEAVQRAGYCPEDEAIILDMIADLTSASTPAPPAAPSNRSCLQNFESSYNFLTERVWASMSDGDMQALVDHLVRLGLRHPSEPTSMAAALVFLAASEGLENAKAMNSQARLTTIRIFKRMVRERTKGVIPPIEFLAALPASPEELKTSHPILFAEAFGHEAPMASSISAVQLEALKAGTRMRAVRRGSLEEIRVPGINPAMDSNMMMNFGQAMLQQMSCMSQAIAGLQHGVGARPSTALPALPGVAQQLMLPNQGHLSLTAPAPGPAVKSEPAPALAAPVVGEACPAEACPEKAEVPALPVAAGTPTKSVGEATAAILKSIGKDVPKSKAKAAGGPAEGASAGKPKAKAKGPVHDKIKSAGKGKAGGKGQAGDKGKAGGKGKAAGKVKSEGKGICITHEASRSQFLVRMPNHPSKIFRYVDRPQKNALSDAKKWARGVCLDLGIEVPDRLR